MNMHQSTNRLVETVAAHVETEGNEASTLAIALQNYWEAQHTGLDIGSFIISDWDIVDHGIESSQYFQGCGVAFTDFEHVATGCGDNPQEALNDCLEQIAMQSVEIDPRLEKIVADYPLEPSAEDRYEFELALEPSDMHYYVSIRYNRQFSHTDTATEYAASIVNGNCEYVVEQLQAMPATRALAVAVYIVEYLPSVGTDHSYRSRFMSALGIMAD